MPNVKEQLTAIESNVIELFALVAEDLVVATDGLLSGDSRGFKELAERELVIDRLYREVEEVVNRYIALQAPVAADLRLVLSVLRIVPELEFP